MPSEQRGKHVSDWLEMPDGKAVTDEKADRIALKLRPIVIREMLAWRAKGSLSLD